MMAEGILTANLPAKGKRWWKFVVCMLAGVFCGAGLGHTIGRYLKHSHKVSHVSASDIGALTLTAFYVGASFLVLWLASDRMRLARVLEGKAAEVYASDVEVRSFRYQALVMALAGILLAAPLLSVHFFSGNYVHRALFIAVIVPLFAAQTFYNFRLWKISDEFVRGSMLATATWTFAIGQGGLFLVVRGGAHEPRQASLCVEPDSRNDALVPLCRLGGVCAQCAARVNRSSNCRQNYI